VGGVRERAKASIDDLDRQLLSALQADGRRSSAELARGLKLSGPGLQKRLRKLEDRGVIRNYAAIVNREAVGLDLLCFVHIMLAHHRPDAIKRFPEKIKRMPEVLECHFLTGEFDYLLKVVVASHEELEKFLFEKLMKVSGVDRTRTSIVVKEVKATTSLPL
jgi:Lrp/AsnC family transcriptional regulator, leucine-responsive regulatory protein